MSVGTTASLRLRLSQADAHYGGDLVAGGRVMELFGDVATELCIRSDGDEGLLAGYSSVEFLAPLSAGDFVEVRGEIVRAGRASREMSFQVLRYAAPRPDVSDSAADPLEEPVLVARASGTCVVQQDRQRRRESQMEGSGS
ncbi:MAG: hotdog fold domain-containing protein [Actinomycetota bacterium]